MSFSPLAKKHLQGGDYVAATVVFELTHGCCLPPFALFQLRRELLQALKRLAEQGESTDALQQLICPELSSDPQLVRRYQKPAPAFVLSPPRLTGQQFSKGQRLSLPLFLLGGAAQQLESLLKLLQEVARQGLFNGSGRCELVALNCIDSSGQESCLWQAGQPLSRLTPPVNELGWWLERQVPVTDRCRIELVSPLRLLRQGKPLFNPAFQDFFSFVARRVTSMLAYHSALEFGDQLPALLTLAADTQIIEQRLDWRDWRRLENEKGGQALGGSSGFWQVENRYLPDILWLLQLGTLFNVGKGAPFGNGQYRLIY